MNRAWKVNYIISIMDKFRWESSILRQTFFNDMMPLATLAGRPQVAPQFIFILESKHRVFRPPRRRRSNPTCFIIEFVVRGKSISSASISSVNDEESPYYVSLPLLVWQLPLHSGYALEWFYRRKP